ncbi:unnamed protein product, partial [Mesorhabditis belari]|uniref:PH domain-containing protein n=1 Tax=Mesorhabditis belari TaxID=2138241 RepID=A0AAF3J6I7_9BILA
MGCVIEPEFALAKTKKIEKTRMPSTLLEEEPGVLKSGVISCGWTPVKSKKSFYAVLVERALELHESEKTYRKKKPPKHTIDLSVAFNVHTDHFDPKMKRCMCLSGPDDALLIKGENENSTNDWYSAILDALIPARATRLGRPVQPLEFFEYVWDVEIVQQPKLKRAPAASKTEEPTPNMCEKTPGLSGPKRLCFYAHTIILCKRRIESVTANLLPDEGVPPFATEDFIELSRKYIATFGCCEKYFLIRMGRGSPMGACELWAQCENEEVAADIHDKLNRIIEREAEKKKKLGNGPVMPGLSHHHPPRNRVVDLSIRDRINTLPATEKKRIGSPSFGSQVGSRKTSFTGTPMGGGFESPFGFKSGAGPPGRINSISSMPHYNSGKMPRRPSEVPSDSASRKNTPRDGRPIGLDALQRLQPNVSQSTQEETEDSGGTLRLEGSTREADSVSMNSRRSIAVEATIERRPPSMSEDTDMEATSSCSSTAGMPSGIPEDYAPMDAADWTVDGSFLIPTNGSKDKQYHLDEVRSYVSDSSDSCYSSLANNTGATLNKPGPQPPRAYSFGARTVPQAVAATFNNGTNVTMDSGASLESASKEALVAKSGLLTPLDPETQRLRAFSLGSKHLYARPFRKLSQHANRSTRHSQTTASGVSLASSSNASSTGQPTTSSSNHQISAITSDPACDGTRNRSGSFGSGRSTPFNRRGGSVGGPGSERGPSHDHLVEIDFGGAGMGRSGSGSVHSVDSPSRSRTSSFGGKTEFQRPTIGEPSEEEPIHEEPLPIPATITQSILKNSIFKDFHGNEYGDYVATQINDPTVFVQAGAAEEVAYCVQHHLGTAPQDVGRQSQHFETIQETTSGNNSRCSSRTSIHKIDDDYAFMDGSEKEMKRSGGRSPLSGVSARARSRSTGRPVNQTSTPVVLEADEDYVGCKIASFENGRNSETSSESALTIDTNVQTPTSSTVSPAVHRAFVGKPKQEHKKSFQEHLTSPLALPSNPMPKPSSLPHQMNEPHSTLNYAMLQVSLEPKLNNTSPNSQKNGVAQPRRSRSRSGTSPVRFGSKTSAATATSAPMPPETIEYTILQGKP